LNEYTSRGIPSYSEISGSANASATVTVNLQRAIRQGNYFWDELAVSNTTSPLWLALTNLAVLNNGTNADIIGTNQGNVFVKQTPEVFNYDADGNLTNDGRWAYIWDAENRLVKMTANTLVGPQYQLNFVYDAQSRRIQKIVATNGVAISTNNFVYDGWNLAAELNPNGTLVRSYIWGSDLSGSAQGAGGVGGLIAVSYHGTATTNCFAAFDGNGNIAALINAADGSVSANYEYAPFGELVRETGPLARNNPFRFSTKYQDDESDLLYYGYRYYNASTGRWPNRDPLSERGGINLFAFIGNNPINCYDKIGQQMAAPTPGPGCPDPCPILKAAIETALKVLRGRYMDMLMDVQDQYNNAYLKPPTPPYTTTWEGHEEQYNGVQNRLRNKLQEFYEEHCNDTLPPDTSFWAMEPAPIAPNSVQNPGVYGPPALPPGSTYDFITPQDVANSPITQNNPYAVNANPYSTTPGLNQQQLNEISILMLSPAAFAGATLLPEVSVPVLLRTAWAY
jgi:RHS repeat-associated protein